MMSNKPAVTFITNHLDGGGVEKVFLTLMNDFCSKGITVNLILTRKKGIFLKELDNCVQIHNLNCRLKNAFLPMFLLLRKMDAGPIICGPQYLSFLIIFINLLLRRKFRIIATHHSLDDFDVRSIGLAARFEKLLIRYFYRKAFKVVGVSNGVVNYLKKNLGLPDEKVQLIYNPAITLSLNAKAREYVSEPWLHPNVSGKLPVIVAVGRLSRIKCFDLLISAVKQVIGKMPVRLIIVGDGPERNGLEKQIMDLGLSPYVKITGFTSNPYPYIASADIFVSSSESETFSLVIAEALYLGTSVIATRTVGAREVLDNGKYGVIVPLHDIDALADALLTSLKEGNKTVYIKECLEWLEQFNINVIATKYINLAHA